MNQEPISRRAARADAREGISRRQAEEDVNGTFGHSTDGPRPDVHGTPYDRLMAESLPTGTFGHAVPPTPGPRPWTAIEQAEHRRTLDEALDSWEWNRDERRTERRHLRLVDTKPDTRAA